MELRREKASPEGLESYVEDCLKLAGDSGSLLGIFIADLDNAVQARENGKNIILIVKENFESIWGNSENPSEALKDLNIHCFAQCGLPLGFPICAGELFPPYPESRRMTPLILSLKYQSEKIYGDFDMDSVPTPSAHDILYDEEKWGTWESYLEGASVDETDAGVFLRMIARTLAIYLQTEKGIFEFDLRKVIPLYLENDPPFVDAGALLLVQDYFESGNFVSSHNSFIKRYALVLRTEMLPFLNNKHFNQ